MIIKYPEIGICGLSCRLCPRYHTESKSKILHSILDEIAERKNYYLKLRK